jgi:HemY protein
MRFLGWRRRRQRVHGEQALTRTLVALAASEPGVARRESARARKLLGDTPQTLLLAAEAGRLAEREDEATEIYRTLAARQDAALLGLRGLFRQAMTREAWSEAAAIARRAEEVHPAGAWLRDERAQLAVRTGNWAEALRLAGPNAPRAALATAAAQSEPDPQTALKLSKQAWKQSPGFAPAALAYAKNLRAAGRDSRAFDVIREAWRAKPQPELAAFWLDPIGDKLTRVREAGRLAAANPDAAETHLMLAGVHLAAGLTGEARHHLEAARAAGMNQKRFWVLLADVEAAERGETEAGRIAQRDALRRAATAEPDPRWHCEVCGTEQPHWLPICPACHTPGRITWSAARLALPAS